MGFFLAGGGALRNLMLQHRTGTGIPIARKGRAGREASGFGGQGVRYTAPSQVLKKRKKMLAI